MSARNGADIVIEWSAALLMLAALGGVPAEPSAAAPIQFAQLTVRQQILVRVPVQLRPVRKPDPNVEWKESKGPKCIAARSIAGATALRQKSFDLILRDRSRIRARLDRSCPALDYYYGFYISPDADGRICADRDSIRSRVGGECEIDAFRKLRPEKRDD
jgi:hypothetical protein